MSLNVKKLKSENPEVTVSLIEEVEIVLGVKLPESYISLMKKWNGGYFDQEYQVLLSNDVPEELDFYLGEGFWGINSIAGISSDKSNSEGILYTAQAAFEWGVEKQIIALEGDGHTWIALDFRENKDDPTVIFIETEKLLSFQIARSFDDFLNKIVPLIDS
ncbi:SMI1/KNR4 family protein [Salinimonas sediminis]|uniref:Knr4/Smi1-like domain-containing protein n=1 Tax=Salinimonas sediminis TaxID=2303538 RepID=A0A346NMK3_9ALTE|nr:SMI1/KNR4 family protein [Salinimonas sediminis]AXR06760.1 hypothetical protein D0Y50_10530 [Salinimonas sediminis]